MKFSDRYLVGMVWRHIRKYKPLFYGVIITLLLNVILGISAPLVLETALRLISENVIADRVILPAIAYGSLIVGSWFLRASQFALFAKLNSKVTRDLRDEAFSKALENKVEFYDTQKSGDLTSRIVNDVNELFEASRHVAWVVTDILFLILVVSLFFYFSSSMAIFMVLFIPFVLTVSFFMGSWERKVSDVWRKRFGEVNARFSDIMSKITISKAFHREKENLIRFNELNEATFEASKKRGFVMFLFWPITDLMQHALTLMVIAVGTWQVSQGLSLTTFIMFIILTGYFYWPLISIAHNYTQFQSASASLGRIAAISEDIDHKEVSTGRKLADEMEGEIIFNRVSFSYDGRKQVLDDISFSIRPGERVALIGQTGAGKSTIASLLMRFYDTSSGEILIDRTPIGDYDLHSLRKNISLVSQRTLLFKGTIRENMKIALPEASDEQIWTALDMVQAREFIEQLPNGLDSMVEENGKNLSAGQKQSLSFARALLSNPRLIILDEATSAVDLYTESKIQDAIDILLRTRTSISIAHRLTTILKSDKIIVLHEGRIIQIGNHQELLQQEGPYAEMYQLYLETQSAKYLTKILSA